MVFMQTGHNKNNSALAWALGREGDRGSSGEKKKREAGAHLYAGLVPRSQWGCGS